MPVEDQLVWPVLDALLDCLKIEFAKHNDPPKVIRHQVGNGNAVAQIHPNGRTNECCSGLAWVRLATFYPSGNAQMTPVVSVGDCYPVWAMQVELGAVRCWPKAGRFADPEDWALSANLACQDATVLRRAVLCCFMPGNIEHQAAIGAWRPLGVTGQCVGGVLTVTVSPVAQECCPPDPPDPPGSED